MMWTDLPCQNFHLLVCCAILDSEKQKIMEENFGFNEILKVSPRRHKRSNTKSEMILMSLWICCSTSMSFR